MSYSNVTCICAVLLLIIINIKVFLCLIFEHLYAANKGPGYKDRVHGLKGIANDNTCSI